MDDPILARTGDPVTSHLAADRLVESGKWRSQKALVLGWMRDHSIIDDTRSLTAHEIAAFSNIAHPVCHKRLPDLEKEFWVAKAVKRDCGVTGELCWTWRVVGESERLELLARAVPVSEGPEEGAGGGES